jgi:hypothetical protein
VSQAGSEREGVAGAARDELIQVVAELRAELNAVRTSLEASIDAFGKQLDRAAAATTAIAGGLADELRTAITQQLTKSDAARQAGIQQLATQLAAADAARQEGIERLSEQLRQQLGRADEQRTVFTEQVTNQLSHADVALRAGIERLLVEVAGAREAAERRSGSRWRRGAGDDASATTGRAARSEPRIDQALRELDEGLTSLAQLVERAVAFSDDAAQAAIATFRAVTAPRPASSPGLPPEDVSGQPPTA